MVDIPLLMTASVDTRGMKRAMFSAAEREQMYVNALRFYLRKFRESDQKIVFCENSGWDEWEIRKNCEDLWNPECVEYVRLDPHDFDISRGKGYNEVLMVKQAIARSSFIQEAHRFLKVTGRYPVFNIKFFLREASSFFGRGCVFYMDVKDHSLYEKLGLQWNGHNAYSVLFASTVGEFESAIGSRYMMLDDFKGYPLERLMFEYMRECRNGNCANKVFRFGREPICGGKRGHVSPGFFFRAHNLSVKDMFSIIVGNVIRTCTPWFWF